MKTEKALTLVFLLALIGYFFGVVGSLTFLLISLLGISLMYFPLALFFYADKNLKQQKIELSIIGGMVLSITPLALLFKIAHWTGHEALFNIAITLTPLFLIVLIMFNKKKSDELKTYYQNFLLRTVFWLLLLLCFYFV
jgi:hypothetical protein